MVRVPTAVSSHRGNQAWRNVIIIIMQRPSDACCVSYSSLACNNKHEEVHESLVRFLDHEKKLYLSENATWLFSFLL